MADARPSQAMLRKAFNARSGAVNEYNWRESGGMAGQNGYATNGLFELGTIAFPACSCPLHPRPGDGGVKLCGWGGRVWKVRRI